MRRTSPASLVLVFLAVFLGSGVSGEPRFEHGLHYQKPATVWDEAIPLGNGLLGALVWGDGRPLRISLDRTDLWDLRPVPEFHTEEYSYKMMRRWVQERRLTDLHRLYDDPYGNPGPTKIPAGRIEITFADNTVFEKASLDLAEALTTILFDNGDRVRVFVHATEPFGMIQADTKAPIGISLLAPPFAGKVTDEAGPGKISAGDLASLRYKPPVESGGDDWKCYLQEGWGGFKFAVAATWRRSQDTWLGAWSISTSNQSQDPSNTAVTNCRKALQTGFAEAFSSHRRWWDSYWGRSSVRVPNPIIERQWYLEMYKFGSAARAGHAAHHAPRPLDRRRYEDSALERGLPSRPEHRIEPLARLQRQSARRGLWIRQLALADPRHGEGLDETVLWPAGPERPHDGGPEPGARSEAGTSTRIRQRPQRGWRTISICSGDTAWTGTS